ncbi:MAG: LysE family transporter [Verrucomicrobiota bacterium]|jgi:threonine/homoserine/homoserine lactone efflux protein
MLFNLDPCLVAALTGFVWGFLLSVPVGPVNVTIINEGARRGLLWAWMIGFGAVVMEVVYCALAFTGFATLLTGPIMQAAMELSSFVFMLWLGIRFLKVRAVNVPGPVEERIKVKLNPTSAFALGFVRVMANPGVFLGWVVLGANFISRGWVAPSWQGRLCCVAGVAGGTGIWFSGLSYAVSRGHGKFTEKTLLRMEHISGICMLALAVIQGAHMVWQMAKHRI